MTTKPQHPLEAMEYTARIHHEDGTYWAEVPELPGVFASGDNVDELLDGLKEAVALYLGDTGETSTTELSELKLAVTA
jgi:predicted RNase H-like HicB family nuclease